MVPRTVARAYPGTGEGARLKQSGFFDTDAIAAMADAHIAGSRDFSKPLWLLWVFGSFLDHAAQAN